MKKLFLYAFLGLLWCNVGFADILLKNCQSLLENGELRESRGSERDQFFLNFEDGNIYHTVVYDDDFLQTLVELRKTNPKFPIPEKTDTEKYKITFKDKKLVTGKRFDKGFDYFVEIAVRLDQNVVEYNYFAHTSRGEEAILMRKKIFEATGQKGKIRNKCDREL